MPPEPAHRITFGAGGSDISHLGEGWSGDEPGHRWMIGPRSELWLENPRPAGNYRLELELAPFCRPPGLAAQRLAVQVRGEIVAQSSIAAGGKIQYDIPAELLSTSGPVRVIFHHPDAACPVDYGEKDERLLAFSIATLTLYRIEAESGPAQREHRPDVPALHRQRMGQPELTDLMSHFVTLGSGPEFGLVQRSCGIESLNLMRFASIAAGDLAHGLEVEFAGVADVAALKILPSDQSEGEYTIHNRLFNLQFRTGRFRGEIDETGLPGLEARRIRFLLQVLLDQLRRGDRIFVYVPASEVSEDEVLRLYAAVTRYGGNRLLWVEQSDEQHAAGSVDLIRPGLLKGYMDRFAPKEDPEDVSLETWLAICANAYRLAPSATATECETADESNSGW